MNPVLMILIASTVINVIFLFKLYQHERIIHCLRVNSDSFFKALLFMKNGGNLEDLKIIVDDETDGEDNG